MTESVRVGQNGIETGRTPQAQTLQDVQFLTELRQQMLKFARLQLRDDDQAEDAVQEALAGALKNEDSFKRQAALRTWVFSILKYKIADILRYRQRVIATSELGDDEYREQAFMDGLFNSGGHWHKAERPSSWTGPQGGVHSDHFWRVFDACLNGLPEKQARVFMMREFIELESEEICEQLTLSTSNLHVTLYRARLRLRECLENGWFDPSTAEDATP
ncbi:RNA polymerase factor sigma-70 [Microbulbifer agarilyticus]|uniref:RNA polymerase factor sigma-70 n=1 Tax=Microbulbifer agarilyticus TaxID=260552 RepID=UPI001CD6BF93|nr:RNA polymerase factor sigma-70 [Microbulbifer agarilyticus]MCA0901552.1 RNA polymerase factor sigma-70 [Microbulbifer agarilyticus]